MREKIKQTAVESLDDGLLNAKINILMRVRGISREAATGLLAGDTDVYHCACRKVGDIAVSRAKIDLLDGPLNL